MIEKIQNLQQSPIQVVIRLKPQQLINHQSQCVYLSKERSDELVVETPNKKQYFVFDDIADQNCTQLSLYDKIGKKTLQSCKQGYNCCIFAYGQTGAGKTYSILGKIPDIMNDLYSQHRGILPRLISDLFVWINQETDRASIKCSYMQIYNEQIFDLLHQQAKTKIIRQDLKRGVFVEGITVQNIHSYPECMELLFKGIKNRKIAATSMNDQSSRSHTIFTIQLQYQINQGQHSRLRKSKINIVDLAGSQRAKLAKVQGQRLKEGCNINKSLHVLGNVINALVESNKKKKHIPYRDSKLTYYLRDSLGGNSITKLLANIQPTKKYLGDTLSTLMFAKRAKIIRMKVQANQKSTETFQSLRNQIRKLRSQLAQAKYIQNQTKYFQRNDSMDIQSQNHFNTQQNGIFNQSDNQISYKNNKILQVFQENQLHYKGIIQVYESHMQNCGNINKMNIHYQWKNLQKTNQSLNNLLRNFPAFTKIFRQNIDLKNDLQKIQIENNNIQLKSQLNKITIPNKTSNKIIDKINNEDKNKQIKFLTSDFDQGLNKYCIDKKVQEVISYYQNIINNIQQKVITSINILEKSYEELLQQNKEKDQKIKQLIKRRQQPKDIDNLVNENQYLKLNILELQQQIQTYQKDKLKHKFELKRQQQKNIRLNTQIGQDQHSIIYQRDKQYIKDILQKIQQIKKTAQKQIQQIQFDKSINQSMLLQLKQQVIKLKNDNKLLLTANKQLKKKLRQYKNLSEDNRSNKSNKSIAFTQKQDNNNKAIIDNNINNNNKSVLNCSSKLILQNNSKFNISQYYKQSQQLNTYATNSKLIKTKNQNNQSQNKYGSQHQTYLQKQFQFIKQIKSLHNQYGLEIEKLKQQKKFMQKQINQYVDLKSKIKMEFSKNVDEAIDQYRILLDQKAKMETMLNTYHPKSPINNFSKSPVYPRPMQNRWGDSQQEKGITLNAKKKQSGSCQSRQGSKKNLKIPPKFKF